MLVQYSVENYKSIRDQIIINFRVDRERSQSEWAVSNGKKKWNLYKCIGLIGPNASGKTNIIDSILFAFKFIHGTISRKENAKIHVEHFSFDPKYEEIPSCFEFIFYQNEIKYVYGFSVTQKEVVEEYLMGYFSEEPKTIFERVEGQQYDFKGNDVEVQAEIAKKTNKNRLYMPVAAEWGYEQAKEAYRWFDFVSRQYSEYSVSSMIGDIIKDEKRKKILISELQKADFNICDIYIKKKKIDKKSYDIMEKMVDVLFGEMQDVVLPKESPDIRVVHENLSSDRVDISLDNDSAGTSMIVQNIAELMYIGREGGLMIEDELGKTFHTKLTQHFLNMVKSSVVNNGKVQLLFSSHDTKILNLLNYDQIYLVDKNETGATFVKLLDEYDIKEKDIELGYLKGRYGSVPYMKG